jgi:hypothetical protein
MPARKKCPKVHFVNSLHGKILFIKCIAVSQKFNKPFYYPEFVSVFPSALGSFRTLEMGEYKYSKMKALWASSLVLRSGAYPRRRAPALLSNIGLGCKACQAQIN